MKLNPLPFFLTNTIPIVISTDLKFIIKAMNLVMKVKEKFCLSYQRIHNLTPVIA